MRTRSGYIFQISNAWVQRAVIRGANEPSEYDIAWMQHELIESYLMNQGLNATKAHKNTLEIQNRRNSEIWPEEIYWKHRYELGNETWDKEIREREDR